MTTSPITVGIPQWDLADRMRKTLRASGMGVQEIADEFGVSRNTVGAWINGANIPSPVALRLWAMRFGVPLEWLVDGTEPTDGPSPRGGKKLPQKDSNLQPFDYRSALLAS
jgi:transcriptional regulator with XRE-family HTH domain